MAGKRRPAESLVSEPVPKPFEPYLKRNGESIFRVAANQATEEDVKRLQSLIGLMDANFFVDLYTKTNNPIFLWIILGSATKSEDIPPTVLEYLRSTGREIFKAFRDQMNTLEVVQIHPGKEFKEAFSRGSQEHPKPPKLLSMLGLASPSRNLVRSAATDFRDIAIALGIEDNARRSSGNREESLAFVAESLGRTSEDGPSIASIKKMDARGRKLAPNLSQRKKR